MSTKIKICGISTLKDIIEISNMDVDMLGIVSEKNSPRFAKSQFLEIAKHFSTKPIVYVRANGKICDIIKDGEKADIIQIHRILEDNELDELTTYNRKFILYVPGDEKYEKYIDKVYKVTDLALLDSPRKGEKLNLSYARKVLNNYPDLGIAGGINPSNIKNYIELNPAWIDISSGVESFPGKKDLDKIKTIIGVLKWKYIQ
ncbi:phosphoribosylanthranilate isomerase [Acidianus brierleyi]|uniref:phosphoribosylanthranilate isomerase n=1 Tax=Acidianus brierleyi TaxID=41673 RepID=UPI0014432ED1|nr:phosphoribosylanthranilate isomerase [Acidianus brierleyi]AWR94972.2 N-(5'-phosphoribosyl)anthranilate isomerase [Acidianus brierleyi]